MITVIAGSQFNGFSDGTKTNAQFNAPGGIVLAPHGTRLLVCDTSNHCIRSIDATSGQTTTIAGCGEEKQTDGPALKAAIREPRFMAFDRSNECVVYITSVGAIRRLDLRTGSFSPVSAPSPFTAQCCGQMCLK